MKKYAMAAGFILAVVAIYYAAQSVTAIVFAVIYAFRIGFSARAGGELPDVGALTAEIMALTSSIVPWIIIVAAAVSLPLYYLIYMSRRQELWTFISLRGLNAVSVPVLVVFALSVNVLVELFLTLLYQFRAFSGFFEQYEQLSGMFTGGGFIMSLVGVGVVGPIFEELLFRGLVFGELRKVSRLRTAIIIQAVLFGLYHMNVIQGSYAFLIGLLLGFIYYRSNSIFAPAIVHIAINSSSVIFSYTVPAGQLEQWGGVIVVAGVALFFLTGAFLLLGKNFRRCMDNSLYEQNRLPKPEAQGGGQNAGA